jgi:hypothetical protein
VRKRYAEVQGPPRIPVKLPIPIKWQAWESETENDTLSANGELFHRVEIAIGSTIDFTIRSAVDSLGTDADVKVEYRVSHAPGRGCARGECGD